MVDALRGETRDTVSQPAAAEGEERSGDGRRGSGGESGEEGRRGEERGEEGRRGEKRGEGSAEHTRPVAEVRPWMPP